MKRILIAGIGNIFFGDDAFGCEVVRALAEEHPFPPEATVTDFGIRGYDLACALTEPHDAVILVDATPRGEPPGTVFLMEIDWREVESAAPEILDGHRLNPVSVLQMARSFGPVTGKLFLVGCEPARLDDESGVLGLSEVVRQAVPQAVERIKSFVREFNGETTKQSSLVPA